MNNIKIGLCQMNVVDNKDENLKKASSMIKKAKDEGADIAVLPEMFNCPYENEKFIEYCERKEDSVTLSTISKLASDLDIYILAGSIPEEIDGKIYNSSFFFDNHGEIIKNHKKVHLFDIDVTDGITFKESDNLSAGDSFNIAETPFGKIGMGICYDLRFVELSRILALNGADMLIFPGAFNLTTGPAHWETLFKSRALDNQVYAIGVAPALNNEANYHSFGHSLVASPWGDIISECGFDEELLVVDIDLDKVKKVREEIPVLKNRRSDLYEVNEK